MKKMAEDPKADQWDILMLPALALDSHPKDENDQRRKMRDGVFMPLEDPLRRQAGEALWSSRFGSEWLLSKRSNIGIYDFEALYQQMPYAKEGTMFKREWFTIVDKGPGNEVWARIRAWDKAATAGGGARSAGVKMSWGMDDYIYVEHVVAEQVASAERDELMIEIGKQDYLVDGPFLIWHPQDPGSAGLDSALAFNNLLADNGLMGTFDQVTGSKEYFAGMLATKAKAGRVRLVRGTWNDEYLDELAAFPKGRFKDKVDAGSSAYSNLRLIVEELKANADDLEVYEERVQISPV